jgi:hypothetical protein
LPPARPGLRFPAEPFPRLDRASARGRPAEGRRLPRGRRSVDGARVEGNRGRVVCGVQRRRMGLPRQCCRGCQLTRWSGAVAGGRQRGCAVGLAHRRRDPLPVDIDRGRCGVHGRQRRQPPRMGRGIGRAAPEAPAPGGCRRAGCRGVEQWGRHRLGDGRRGRRQRRGRVRAHGSGHSPTGPGKAVSASWTLAAARTRLP